MWGGSISIQFVMKKFKSRYFGTHFLSFGRSYTELLKEKRRKMLYFFEGSLYLLGQLEGLNKV